ncbi:MAG: hypothetical protein DRQ43_06870, partial [Gammaproteobacteria bacterium]
VGFISILIVSAMMFYHQDGLNESLTNDKVNKQELVSQIKTELNTEYNARFDNLTKQSTEIINQQFADIKNSIRDVKKQTEQQILQSNELEQKILQNNWQEQQALQNDWLTQHQLLQKNMTQSQTEQKNLTQKVTDLYSSIKSMASQINSLQKVLPQSSTFIESSSISPSHYTIQLIGAYNKESIRYFAKQHKLSDTSQLVKTERLNKAWYILVQGNYKRFSDAQKDLRQLPEALQKNKPWIKKLP